MSTQKTSNVTSMSTKMKKKKFENEAYLAPETDVLNYVTKSSTKKQRRKFDIGDIFINAAVCLECNTYIRSKNRHDYVQCECGKLAVDGGSWYAKRNFAEGLQYVDIIEKFYD